MTKPLSLMDLVRRRTKAKGRGIVFSSSDFLDLGSRTAVDKALSRLAAQGVLRRLRRGVYDNPEYNDALKMVLSPKPDAIARALARSKHSRLQVSGAYAANLLGLTEQVPARIVYLTDGAAGRIRIGNLSIELRHASPRNMSAAGRISGTVIQALRHLGSKHVDEEVTLRLKHRLSDEDKRTLRKDVLLAPGWMRPIMLEITENQLSETTKEAVSE